MQMRKLRCRKINKLAQVCVASERAEFGATVFCSIAYSTAAVNILSPTWVSPMLISLLLFYIRHPLVKMLFKMYWCICLKNKKRKENHAKSCTFRSSRFDGSRPGLREEIPVCPEKLFLTGDKGVLLSGVEEEFGFLTICSFGSLKKEQKRNT